MSSYIFFSPRVFTLQIVPQVWRLFTAFLITKPKFAILLDPYFLYQYGSGLERESSRFSQPGDFFIYTLFLGAGIVVSTHFCAFCLHSYTSCTCRIDTAVCDVYNLGLMTTSDYLPIQHVYL